MPRILVLLATFNGQRWLDDQLTGIIDQRGVAVSVLAADDGSHDGTVSLLRARAAAGAPLQLLPHAERRLGAAGNFLRLLREADLAGVDAVALADQDDLWPAHRLAGALARMVECQAQGWSSDVTAFWPDGRHQALRKAFAQRRFDHLFEPAGPGCTYVMSAALARALQAELRRQPQRFEGLGYHDWLIYAFARINGHRWIIDAEPSVMYRQHDTNELGANAGVGGLPVRWRRLTSGWFRQQVLQIGRLWGGPHDEVIGRLDRLRLRDRLWLAAHARELRRRPRDQLALAAMCVLGVLR